MIEARGLTKRFGDKVAVDQLSFTVRPGRVTGFLGPNGAGKSTTMRMILGLDEPTSGSVLVDGRPYRQLPYPMRNVGALLEATAMHRGRSAYGHLLCLAQANGLRERRVREVLALVGLTDVAEKRAKGFSMGMSQRLGIAAALLGDPRILLFDEPVNGLDPEGIRWIRNLMKMLAVQGRTVFVSSHLMSEMQNTADHLIVIGRGRLIADCIMAEFIGRFSAQIVHVRTPQPDVLARLVAEVGGRSSASQDGALVVHGLGADRISDLAYGHGVRLHEVATTHASLEEAYMALTAHTVEYRAGAAGPAAPAGPSQGGPAWQGAPSHQPAWQVPPGPGRPLQPSPGPTSPQLTPRWHGSPQPMPPSQVRPRTWPGQGPGGRPGPGTGPIEGAGPVPAGRPGSGGEPGPAGGPGPVPAGRPGPGGGPGPVTGGWPAPGAAWQRPRGPDKPPRRADPGHPDEPAPHEPKSPQISQTSQAQQAPDDHEGSA